MARFYGVDEKEMSARQREVADRMIAGGRGHAGGLMALWLHQPDYADHVQEVGEYLRFKATLPGNVREMIILIVARDWRCYHEWLVHEPIARKNGLSGDVIEAIRAGSDPHFEDDAEAAVYDYVKTLLEKRRVSDAQFDAVREKFGVPGVIEVSGLIGHYIVGAAILNAAEHDLPSGVSAPF